MKRLLLLVVHWAIILNLLGEFLYGGYMVFFVVRPAGTGGPLLGSALEISHEMMVTRRLYAIESWIAFAGLAVYLAITEIGPRLKAERKP